MFSLLIFQYWSPTKPHVIIWIISIINLYSTEDSDLASNYDAKERGGLTQQWYSGIPNQSNHIKRGGDDEQAKAKDG
jgi:hypothetical protein